MSGTEKPKAKPPALDNMWDVDDIVAPTPSSPTPAQREAIAASSAKLGFTSREAPAPKVPTPRPPALYPGRLALRVREEDKERIQELAYRMRMPLGEVFQMLLDLEEKHRGKS